MRIAILGTESPSASQIDAVRRAVAWVKKDHPQAELISGCSEGIGEAAVSGARGAQIRTIGVVPWRGYNAHVQKLCDKILCLYDVDAELQIAAQDTVMLYHPAPPSDQEDFCFQALSYIIVRGANLLIAFPPYNSDGNDPTAQGIRIAHAANITIWCIDDEGRKIDSAKFRPAAEEVSARQEVLTFICDRCPWSQEVQFGVDPTEEGLCPQCGCTVGIFDQEGVQVA